MTPDFCRNGKLAGSTCSQGPAAGLTVVLPANLPPAKDQETLTAVSATDQGGAARAQGHRGHDLWLQSPQKTLRNGLAAGPASPVPGKGQHLPRSQYQRGAGRDPGVHSTHPNTRTKDAADAAALSGRGRASQKLKGPPPSRDAKSTCHK